MLVVRKRLVIAGHSREGLELVPLLEANPAIEVCAIVVEDPAAARAVLDDIDPGTAQHLAGRITVDVERALALPGIVAVIDAGAPPRLRERLLATGGVPVTTPALARMLYAFGPADAFSKPDLLAALREIMDSADLTRDRRSVLDLVLQVAVTATGADRGSLMLWDFCTSMTSPTFAKSSSYRSASIPDSTSSVATPARRRFPSRQLGSPTSFSST
jgi:hypothetical protein